MLVKISNCFIIAIFIIIVSILFIIKDRVGNLSYQLAGLSKQIIQERSNIHLLKAEIAYLTSPSRLNNLATTCLKLEHIKTSQIIQDPLKAAKELKTTEHNLVVNLKRQVKWRYKKAPGKYLPTACARD